MILIAITACSPVSPASNPTESPSPTEPQIPTETIEPATLVPTNTPVPQTPTDTPDDEIVILTNESPDVVLTSVNLQLEDKQEQLTQSAEENATLQAQIYTLQTQVAEAATNANTGSSSSSGSNSGYVIPSNVYTVTIVDKATVFVASTYNKQGAPVMAPYVPRVYLEAGRTAWVYKTPVVADGGAIYYQSYDPDGESSDLKVYFRSIHIQIRLPNGKPDPDNYPGDVAKALLTDNTVLFVASTYDLQGKPVMVSYQPLIKYKAGDYEIVYPAAVTATGGEPYYPVYDPDGTPSGYIRAKFVTFPLMWE